MTEERTGKIELMNAIIEEMKQSLVFYYEDEYKKWSKGKKKRDCKDIPPEIEALKYAERDLANAIGYLNDALL